MSAYIYGIDFGTTNSALAILDTRTQEIVKLFTTPSLLFFPEAQPKHGGIQYSVGTAAVEGYVATRMKGRFMKSIKKVLPNKHFIHTKISDKWFKAEDLVGFVLQFLKKQADEFLGEQIKTAVVGRPVVFDENPEKDGLAQTRLEKAARLAGFERIFFQMEPIGAAFTYERQLQTAELVLVGDFGGGTSDFSIMRLRPESARQTERSGDMLAQGGVYIGGDSFDSDIMWHKGTPHFGRGVKEEYERGKWLELPLTYFTNICTWEKMNFLDTLQWRNNIQKSYVFSKHNPKVKNLLTLVEKNLGYQLFRSIEQTKFGLTKQDVCGLDFSAEGIELHETVDIQTFEQEIIQKNLQKIETYLLDFLSKQQIRPEQIDTVFMTGGTAFVRPIQWMFARVFGQDKLRSGDNFNSVAIGLAYSYPSLASRQ